MRSTPILLALLLTLPTIAPPAQAEWGMRGSLEPDTPWDAGGTFMWQGPDTSRAGMRLYFNAVLTVPAVGVSPNAALTGSQLHPGGAPAWRAFLGVWKDCNKDGYVGLGEAGDIEYSALLIQPDVCLPGSAFNHDGRVREFLPLGPLDTIGDLDLDGRLDDDIAQHAPHAFDDPEAMVWGDEGLLGADPPACALAPSPDATQSTGALLAHLDCHAGDRAARSVAFVEDEITGPLTFVDEPTDAAHALLHEPYPRTLWGRSTPQGREPGLIEDGSAGAEPTFNLYDCGREPSGTASPLAIVLPADPSGGALRGWIGTQDAGVALWNADGSSRVAWHPGDPFVFSPNTIDVEEDLTRPTSVYHASNRTAHHARHGCDPEADSGLRTLELDAPASGQRRASDHTFRFHVERRDHATPGGPLDRPARLDDIVWIADPRPGLDHAHRADVHAHGARYATFYAKVGRLVSNIPLDLPEDGKLFRYQYGRESCPYGFGEGPLFSPRGWDCDPAHWNRDADGRNTAKTQGHGPSRGGSPWGYAREVSPRVGEYYSLRDVDCFDGTLIRGRPSYASPQWFADEPGCAQQAGAFEEQWDLVPELDENANGLGDTFERRYRITREQAEQALNGQGDFDADGAGLLLEFKWDTIPIHEIPGVASYPNARDHDNDNWTDGDEIRFWNVNDEPILPGALAFRDPDSFNDLDNDTIPAQHDPDSDGDGLLDGDEVKRWGTYPDALDSDCPLWEECPDPRDTKHDPDRQSWGDGIPDADEVAWWGAWPESGGPLGDCDHDGIPNIRDVDSDNDDVSDGVERDEGSDPCNADADGDGLADGQERLLRTDPNDPDTDGDGMPDGWEVDHHLDPRTKDADLDRDRDGLTNGEEYTFRSDPNLPDTDRDLLLDRQERTLGTDPRRWDTDGDRMPDGWEHLNGLQPLVPDGTGDLDEDIGETDDGIIYVHTNYYEYATHRPGDWSEAIRGPWLGGTDPRNPDSDRDGTSDGSEVAHASDPTLPFVSTNLDADNDGLLLADELDRHTSPVVVDSDGDGLCDGGGGLECFVSGRPAAPGEVHHYRSNPILLDSDGDGLTDGEEVALFDPEGSGSTKDPDGDGAQSVVDPDADNDGLGDLEEWRDHGTSPLAADTDQDGLTDYEEIVLSPTTGHPSLATVPDTDGDGLSDGDEVHRYGTWPDKEDTDEDGLNDRDEIMNHRTDPHLPDTDLDGMPDGWEVEFGLDPLVDDAALDEDRDAIALGLSNLDEYLHETRPDARDTDGDGLNDYVEVLLGLDPLSPLDALNDDDGDGLSNFDEVLLGTLITQRDTDGDGLDDMTEACTRDPFLLAAKLTCTDPLLPDTDGDGIDDGRERALWAMYGEHAWITDHDQDAILSLAQHAHNLRDADSDNDGLDDGQEMLILLTDPRTPDTDGDGVSDAYELLVAGTDPRDRRSVGGPHTPDPSRDRDLDGLTDDEERNVYFTDPNNADTDGDGLNDGLERILWGPQWNADMDGDGLIAILDIDADGDTIPDGVEFIPSLLDRRVFYILDPRSPDTDEDGLRDDEEASNGFDLLWNIDEPLRSEGGPLPRPWTGADAHGLYIEGPPGARLYGEGLLRANSDPTPRSPSGRANPGPAPDRSNTDAPDDLLKDGVEHARGCAPNTGHSDGDGIRDDLEPPGDADGDGIPNCRDTDSDDDTISDGDEDRDRDGRAGKTETNAYDADTDDDGLCDGEENVYRTRPVDPDTDADGLSDGIEARKRGGCTTPHVADWTLTSIPLAPGRLTYQAYEGSLPKLDPNDPTEDADADGSLAPLDPDSDGDQMIDGLEDWNANGKVDPGEGDPTRADTDGDGLPDSIELQVWGKMTYTRFLDVIQERTGSASLDAAKKRATYDLDSIVKTDPGSRDTDGDGINDGSDINPNGKHVPAIRLVLDKLAMHDPVDRCEFWRGCAASRMIDPYFEFKITTPFGTIEPMTPNLEEIPIGAPGEDVSIAGLALKLFGDTIDASKRVNDAIPGTVEVQLSDDVTYMTRVVSGNGHAFDQVTIEITLGDWDGDNLGTFGGRSPTDVVDINETSGAPDLARRIKFTLRESAAALRGGDSVLLVAPPADGASDGRGNRFTQEDDGRLTFRLENAIKADFLNNALALAANDPTGIQFPRIQEFG